MSEVRPEVLNCIDGVEDQMLLKGWRTSSGRGDWDGWMAVDFDEDGC